MTAEGDAVGDEPRPVAVAGTLQYAPAARGVGAWRPLGVVAAGLGTSAVAVVGVYLLMRLEREDPFHWHALVLIPVGTLLVAAVAASGYVMAAMGLHVRRRRGSVWLGVTLLLLTDLAALYAQFGPFHWISRATGRPLTFGELLAGHATHWRWRVFGVPLTFDVSGPVYRALDVGVFALAGAMAGQGIERPYCDLCRMYLTRRRLALFPASLPYRKLDGLSADDRAEYRADQQEETRAAIEGAKLMMTLAATGDVDAIRQAIDSVRPDRRAVARLPTRLALSVETCPGCRATTLRTALLVGKAVRPLDRLAVSGEFADLR